jgi:hypothetical protein
VCGILAVVFGGFSIGGFVLIGLVCGPGALILLPFAVAGFIISFYARDSMRVLGFALNGIPLAFFVLGCTLFLVFLGIAAAVGPRT